MGVPYPAKTNGPIVIYEPTDKDSGAKTGSVCVVIPITAAIDEDNNWSGKFQQTIFNKDGSPNTIGLDSIKRAFKLESLEHVLDLPNTDTSEIELDAVMGTMMRYRLSSGETSAASATPSTAPSTAASALPQ